LELPCGDVHRNAQRWESGVEPPADLTTCREQRPFAQRNDQAGLLDDRNEVAGLDDAASGIVPADLRLRAGEEAGAERYLRLIGELQLVVVHRLAQAGLQRQALCGARFQLLGAELISVSARPFGAIHRM